jgi:tRNA A-37 threonylcarbamoyl transferase component Bud32
MPDMFKVCPRDGSTLCPFEPKDSQSDQHEADSQSDQHEADSQSADLVNSVPDPTNLTPNPANTEMSAPGSASMSDPGSASMSNPGSAGILPASVLNQDITVQSDELRRQTGVLAAAEEFHFNTNDLVPILSPDSLVDNRYKIVDLLGMGGMGSVYKAEHTVLSKTCAIKLVHPQRFDQDSLQRFKLEAKATSMLKHPNIVGIHDYGINEGFLPYIVMEYLEGKSLESIIQSEGPLSRERFFKVFEQVCDGLGHAHQQGIIHRDLKPANIFICTENGEGDRVKIVDFGIAKLIPQDGSPETTKITLTGEVVGSPLYMSPEQCSGGTLDTRSDIYSLGLVMHEVLTGDCVFDGSPTQVMRKQILEPAELHSREKLSEDMKQIIQKCLMKDPSERFQSVEELKTELLKIKNPPTLPNPVALAEANDVSLVSQSGYTGTWKIVALVIAIIAFLILFYVVKK